MGLTIRVEGGGGTISETEQEQSVLVQGPSVSTAFSAGPRIQIEVGMRAVALSVLAPGYTEMPRVMVLNDLADVEALPEQGSTLQYSDSDRQWIAGFRLVFRPGLRAYIISDA
jgi:hypothetical protein